MKRRKGKARKARQSKRTGARSVSSSGAVIKVVGVGGGGGNAVSRISRDFVRGVEFVAINTDHQDLDHCAAHQKVYIGRSLTRGLGTGMNPDLGRQAAEENRSDIAEALKGADIVFIAAGLGGGTGSGAGPVVAEAAKSSGALTLAFVTKPFSFEGSQRQRIAEEALVKIKDKVDALVVIPNDRIFAMIDKDTSLMKAFEAIDDVLRNALLGIVELIVTPGLINVDFADVRSVVQDSGTAIVGMGVARGEERMMDAVNQALNSPLLEVNPEGAHGILLGIAGGRDLKMNEVNEAARAVAQTVDPGARIIFGAYHDRRLKPNQVKVTLIATGLNGTAPAGTLFGNKFFGGGRGGIFEETDVSHEGEIPPQAGKKGDGKKSNVAETEREEPKPKKEDSWDLPSFLRRKRR